MTDHDATVTAREADVGACYEGCQNARADLIRQVEEWYPGWVSAFAAERVRAKHDRVLKMDPAAVKSVRAEVDRLAAAGSQVVQRHLGQPDPALWPHYVPLSPDLPSALRAAVRSGQPQRRAIHLAQGQLGEILFRAQIEDDRWGSGNEAWTVSSRTNEIAASDASALPSSIHGAIRSYTNSLERYIDARSEYADAHKAREQAQALDAWGG
ncbi:MAG: hypothetical protein JWP11_3422 [Frankiales bacterium]|nr:hypothetical protein [Frankiales bacterium]